MRRCEERRRDQDDPMADAGRQVREEREHEMGTERGMAVNKVYDKDAGASLAESGCGFIRCEPLLVSRDRNQ